MISPERAAATPVTEQLKDPDSAPAQQAAHERLQTEQSRIVIAWFTFGSLVVCVLGAGALLGALFP